MHNLLAVSGRIRFFPITPTIKSDRAILNDGTTSDSTAGSLDSSVGEFGGDTHVGVYAKWIDSVTGGSGGGSTKCNPRQHSLGNC